MAAWTTANNEGTKAFKDGDYNNAINHFSEVIFALDGITRKVELSLALSNRSASFVKLGSAPEALADAERCVSLRPEWAKAHLRLGQAQEAAGNYAQACSTYMDAINRDTSNMTLLMQPLLMANSVSHTFTDDFLRRLQRGKKFCAVCGKVDVDLRKCSGCCSVYYCSEAHQKSNWKVHKPQCELFSSLRAQSKAEEALAKMIMDSGSAISLDFDLGEARRKELRDISDWESFWCFAKVARIGSGWKKAKFWLKSESLTPAVSPKQALLDASARQIGEMMSYTLTLGAAICKFNLDSSTHLRIHILGADDLQDKAAFTHTFLWGLPFPQTHLVLVGPNLASDKSELCETINGRQIFIQYVAKPWHEYIRSSDFVKPDLTIAYQPALADGSYPWMPSLSELVHTGIPSIFTAWDEEYHAQDVRALNNDVTQASLTFQGLAPFPSPRKQLSGDCGDITQSNLYWVGVKGGSTFHGNELVNECMALVDEVQQFAQKEGTDCKTLLKKAQTHSSVVAALNFHNESVKLAEARNFTKAAQKSRIAIEKALLAASGVDARQLSTLYSQLGLMCSHCGDFDGAERAFKQSIAVCAKEGLSSEMGEVYTSLGRVCRERTPIDTDGMLAAFTRATELCPHIADAWHGLGSAHGGNCQWVFADAAYNRALSIDSAHVARQDLDRLFKHVCTEEEPRVQCHVGLAYLNGDGTDENPNKGTKLLKISAQGGDAVAQRIVGMLHYAGKHLNQDMKEAAVWFQKSAQQGDVVAQFNLAGCYEKGTGVSQDLALAAKWLEKAANQEFPAAQLSLGFFYHQGNGVAQDKIRASFWFKKAAMNGNEEAQAMVRRSLAQAKQGQYP